MQPRKCITAEKYNLKNRQPKKWFGSLTRGGRLREALIIGIWLEYFNSVVHRWSLTRGGPSVHGGSFVFDFGTY